jgi:ribosomal-protein-alanine N-acetyltransferase
VRSDLELVCVRWPEHGPPLGELLRALERNGDQRYFHPHSFDPDHLGQIFGLRRQDLYYLAFAGGRAVAYGMLRGWDQGYDVPSLGIAVHPEMRGRGLAEAVMHFLHVAARLRGCAEAMLTVDRDNVRAVRLYQRLGYSFTDLDARRLRGWVRFDVSP